MSTTTERQQLTRAAWFEYKVGKAVGGLATDTMLATTEPPPEFVAVELGLSAGGGPSLLDTLRGARRRDKASASRSRQRQPPRRQRKREHATDRQARLQALLAAARAA